MTRTALLLLLLLCAPAHADTLAGRASIIDADTIEIHGQRIRLWGVDAMESGQLCGTWRCGQAAAFALSDWIGQRTVTCERKGKSFSRIVALCAVAGQDVGAWLVLQGWALDAPKYSRGAYADEQAEAAAARRGLWAGSYIEPWRWRRGER